MKGFIIVAACKGDCVTGLSDKCKNFFEKLGSQNIKNVEAD